MHLRITLFLAAAMLASGGAFAADPPNAKPDADAVAQQLSQEMQLNAARDRLEQAAREVAELSTRMRDIHMPDNLVFLGRNPNRAMLGIGLGGRRESDDGVSVASVSPGGPAAGAGLKAGDVIVELNGKSLKRDKENDAREKLLNEVAKLSPGDEATVKYLRDGKSSIVKFKVDRLPQETARREMRVRVLPGEHEHGEDFNFNFDMPRVLLNMTHGGAFGDMELAPISAKLGQYFGTDKGLLVVHAPERDAKLEDGDVLVDIDGRVPTDPGHAFRILGSYQPGEKVTLNILRQKKKMSLAIAVPERAERLPRAPRAPRAPAAPAPATAPAPFVPSPLSTT